MNVKDSSAFFPEAAFLTESQQNSVHAPSSLMGAIVNKTLLLEDQKAHQENVTSVLPSSARSLKRVREEKKQEATQPQKKQKTGKEASPRLTSSTITKKYLELIGQGKKTIEGRINNGMFARLKAGEHIQFFNGKDKVRCKVVKLNHYTSFESLLKNEGISSCLPDVHTLEKGIQIYNEIPKYAEKAAKYGVLAIHLEAMPITNAVS